MQTPAEVTAEIEARKAEIQAEVEARQSMRQVAYFTFRCGRELSLELSGKQVETLLETMRKRDEYKWVDVTHNTDESYTILLDEIMVLHLRPLAQEPAP